MNSPDDRRGRGAWRIVVAIFVIAVAMNYVWEVTQRKLMVNQVLVGGRVFVSAPMRDAPSVLCEISDRRLYKPEMRDASAEPETVGRR